MSREKLNKKTLLVVEDSLVCQALIKAFLKNTGAIVIMTGTGEEALEAFKNHKIDLVITDLRLPGTSGITLIRNIKYNYPGTPVIVQTASNIDFSEADCIDAGCDSYITKPYSRSLFIDSIIRLLEKKNHPERKYPKMIRKDGKFLQPLI